MTEEQTVTATETTAVETEDALQSKQSSQEEQNLFAQKDLEQLTLSMEEMLEAGVHFGHPKARRHPKMNDFIFTTRNNISIIDLEKTVSLFAQALDFLEDVQRSNKQILFVATKKQTQPFVKALAEYTNNPYVIDRWLGGTLTNFKNIRSRVRYMLQLADHFSKDDLGRYTKLERLKKQEELEKLQRRMGGIQDMENLPGAVFVTDLLSDHLAVKEARKLKIPIVALADSNVNPEDADYPIPANDDALSSLEYMLAHVAKRLKNIM